MASGKWEIVNPIKYVGVDTKPRELYKMVMEMEVLPSQTDTGVTSEYVNAIVENLKFHVARIPVLGNDENYKMMSHMKIHLDHMKVMVS